jgi:hypothetical protein
VILADVAEQISAQLDTIAGLRSFAFAPDKVAPPAAMVTWPEDITFDQTYQRGCDRMTLGVVVVVARPNDRSALDRLGVYCDGSGPSSVKAVLESGAYSAFDAVTVQSAEFDEFEIGGTIYPGALFRLDIIGDGA